MGKCGNHLALFEKMNDGGEKIDNNIVGIKGIIEDDNITKRYIISSGNSIFVGDNGDEISMVRKGKHYIVQDVFYGDGGDYCYYIDSRGEVRKTRICEEDVYGGPLKYRNFKCIDGRCIKVPEKERINNIENGYYKITVEGKEVMVKCSKNHCYKMTDKHVYDIRTFSNSGMYVFEDNYDKDRKMLDDEALNGLRGIVKKPIKLNYCVHGICERTKEGLIKYSRSPRSIVKYEYTYDQATATGTTTIGLTSFVKCDDADHNGKLKSNMDMCIDGENEESKAISGVGVVQDEYATGKKNVYQRTGYNVVGMVISGYYNFGTKIEKCKDCSCEEITSADDTYDGYYINSDTNTDDEYKLIYCEYKSSEFKCENRRLVENGYYWNENSLNAPYHLNICSNSGCIEESQNGNCVGNKNDVVHNGGIFKYCKEGTVNGGVTLPSSGLVYYVSSGNYEPESEFNYPTRFRKADVPEREILIKTQKYSVTAVTGTNIPIGYVKVENNKYLECKYNEEGKKVCVNADVTATECTSDKVGKLITTATGTELCVDPDPTIGSVDLSTGGEYLIPLGSGKFGINGRNDGKEYFIGVKVDDDGNVIVVKEPKMKKYRYTGTDDLTHKKSMLEVYNKSDAVGKETKEIYEYQVVLWPVGSGANPEVDYDISGDNTDL